MAREEQQASSGTGRRDGVCGVQLERRRKRVSQAHPATEAPYKEGYRAGPLGTQLRNEYLHERGTEFELRNKDWCIRLRRRCRFCGGARGAAVRVLDLDGYSRRRCGTRPGLCSRRSTRLHAVEQRRHRLRQHTMDTNGTIYVRFAIDDHWCSRQCVIRHVVERRRRWSAPSPPLVRPQPPQRGPVTSHVTEHQSVTRRTEDRRRLGTGRDLRQPVDADSPAPRARVWSPTSIRKSSSRRAGADLADGEGLVRQVRSTPRACNADPMAAGSTYVDNRLTDSNWQGHRGQGHHGRFDPCPAVDRCRCCRHHHGYARSKSAASPRRVTLRTYTGVRRSPAPSRRVTMLAEDDDNAERRLGRLRPRRGDRRR